MSKAKEIKQNLEPKGFIVVKILSIIFCCIFGLVSLANSVLIVKRVIEKDKPTDIFGYSMFVVNTNYMSGDKEDSVNDGDFIIVKKVAFEELNIGDVVLYESAEGSLILGRIQSTSRNSTFNVQADNLNNIFAERMSESNYFGKVQSNSNVLGGIFDFILSPMGLVLFIGIPVLLIIWVCAAELFDRIKDKSYKK